MNADYTVWRNGDSLVLIAGALSPARAETVLDLQLAAYLDANRTLARTGEGWAQQYLNVQASLGCVFTALQYSPVPAEQSALCTPWALLQQGLLAALPTSLGEPLAPFLASHREALQGLLGECDESVQAGEQVHSAQMRVITPEVIFSSELSGLGDTPQHRQWWLNAWAPQQLQALEHAVGRYALDWNTLAIVGQGLRKRLEGKQDHYRRQLLLPPAKGGQA